MLWQQTNYTNANRGAPTCRDSDPRYSWWQCWDSSHCSLRFYVSHCKWDEGESFSTKQILHFELRSRPCRPVVSSPDENWPRCRCRPSERPQSSQRVKVEHGPLCPVPVQFRCPEDISLLQVKYPLLRADILLLPSNFRSTLESKVLFRPLSVLPLLLIVISGTDPGKLARWRLLLNRVRI